MSINAVFAKAVTIVVFGIGRRNRRGHVQSGKAHGENEDLQGEPFVGRGGQLLDKMLAAVDLSREKNIYIANIVKCRPPQNRDPLPEEQEACIGWLRNQTALIRPKIIVCLGRIAAAKIIAAVENAVEQEIYLKRLQVETGFSMESLKAQVDGSDAELTPGIT